MNLTESNIYNKLELIFCDFFDLPSIKLNALTTANDVDGWDSLTHILLISLIEKEFGMKFKMSEIINMKNIGEMITILISPRTY